MCGNHCSQAKFLFIQIVLFVVPAYSWLWEPCKERERESAALQQKGKGLNPQTDVAHFSNAQKAIQKREEKKLISFGPIYTIPFEDEAIMQEFQERKEVMSG
jgi:hypothetical protein